MPKPYRKNRKKGSKITKKQAERGRKYKGLTRTQMSALTSGPKAPKRKKKVGVPPSKKMTSQRGRGIPQPARNFLNSPASTIKGIQKRKKRLKSSPFRRPGTSTIPKLIKRMFGFKRKA